jgi:hypothetical protein
LKKHPSYSLVPSGLSLSRSGITRRIFNNQMQHARPKIGEVVKYSRPQSGESDFRFLLKEDNGDRVMIELIFNERN